MSLSVAIAVHNEEKNIIRCLESVYDWVDEIVIVDSASTDNTIKVIKKFLADFNRFKLISTDNCLMFHKNKQKAIEACTKDWILQLDADEVVSAPLKQEIQSVISYQLKSAKTKDDDFNRYQPKTPELIATDPAKSGADLNRLQPIAYNIPRLNYFLGKPLRKGGQYPDYTIRLYRNGVARFPCKDVHENVMITNNVKRKAKSENNINGDSLDTEYRILNTDPPAGGLIATDFNRFQPQIGYLKSNLLHFPYPTFKEYLNKWSRYSKLEAERMKHKGIKPSIKLFLDYIFLKPPYWFLLTYFRHKGFVDGWPGFIFSLFSSLRFWRTYNYLNDKIAKDSK